MNWKVPTGVTDELRTIRTDVVGSLLRPAAWKEARARFDDGELDAADFARDRGLTAVREHVALQESIGLDVVSDGEISRLNFQDSFGARGRGLRRRRRPLQRQHEQRVEGGTRARALGHARPRAARARRWCIAGRSTSRLKLERNVPLEEYSASRRSRRSRPRCR